MIVNKLHPLFAAEIVGLDTTRPLPAEDIARFEAAMAEHAVCVVRDFSIRDEDQIAFSRSFGPLELPPGFGSRASSGNRRPIAPQLYDVTNLDATGEIIASDPVQSSMVKGFEKFHTDSSFNLMPTKWSLLLGHVVPPEGANTDFIDTRIVYADLPQAMKERIADLSAVHDFWGGRDRIGFTATEEMRRSFPSVTHPIVRTAADGRKALYIGGHAIGIVGWPADQALALIDELFAFATQEKYIYSHRWRQADLVVWDNRCTLHRATPFDRNRFKRDCRRTTINESGEEQTGLQHYQANAA